MANTRELRRRIKSVKNTSQITKAMQMVSATKMRRAQNQALNGRPYSATLSNVLSQLAGKTHLEMHRLLTNNDSPKIGVLLLSSDKGLAGALNTNLFRKIQSDDLFKTLNIVFYTVGKKGRDFIVRTGKTLEADFDNPEKVTFRDAIKLRKLLVDSFLDNSVGEVYLLYPEFVSTLKQDAKLVKLLPIDVSTIEKQDDKQATAAEFLFEPTPDDVLEFALIHEIEVLIYQALLETKASEHSARMIAMQNATDNASDLVEDLKLNYNQVRQGAITTELLEITSAAAALE